MSLRLFSSLLFVSLIFAACGDVGDAPRARTGDSLETSERAEGRTFTIDTSRSKIGWKAAKVTRAHDGGFRVFGGDISASGDSVTSVRITIDAGSIYADDEKLTAHLRSGDFFGVDSFPSAGFVADRIVRRDSAGSTHLVTGNLKIRNTTRSLTFPATIDVENDEVKARADFIINRKNWNIIYPGAPDDLISDDVRIIFDVVAVAPH